MPTALIVEDEPEANKLLSMLVQLRGYGTDSAFTGGEALAKVELRTPDIVFLDLMLPDINGFEVCKALKARKDTTLIPVVMVTARVAQDNRIQSYCTGADQYVPKPYTPDEIFHAMSQAENWRRKVAGQAAEGEIGFSTGDDGEALRQLARLRSLLLAFTPLDDRSTCRVREALVSLLARAEAWGKAAGVSSVAALSYRTLPDRVELKLRDLSGWLRDDPLAPAEIWPEAVASGFRSDPMTFVVPFTAA